MAVIRRTVSVTNKRIGVNNFDTGADQIGFAIADAGEAIRDRAFRIDAQKAEEAGADAALSVDAEKFLQFDAEGKPTALETPEGFGRIARESFKKVAERRFIETVDKDLRNEFAELSVKYDRDPLGFDRAAEAYLTGLLTVDTNNKFQQQILDIGADIKERAKVNIMKSERNRIRQNATQHIASETQDAKILAIEKARLEDVAGAKEIAEERRIATQEGEGAGFKIGSSDVVKDDINGAIAGAYLSTQFQTLSRQDRIAIIRAAGVGGTNVVLSKEAQAVYSQVSDLITPSNQASVLAELRSNNSAIISDEDFALRTTQIAANEKLNNLLQTYEDVNFALEKSYAEQANIAIDTTKDFDAIFGGTYAQLTARIDEIKDLTSMVEGDGKPLNSTTSLNMQEEAKRDFITPWLLNAAAQGEQDQLKNYILTGTHNGKLNSYQVNTVDKLKEFGLLLPTDVNNTAVKTLLNTDIGKLVDQQKEQQLKVDLSNEAYDLSAQLAGGFDTTRNGESFAEIFSDKVSKSGLDPTIQDTLGKIVQFGALRGEINGIASGLSSSQIEDVISYIESGGQTDIDEGITKTLADKILAEKNEETIEAGTKHLDDLRSNAVQREANANADRKFLDNMQTILEGKADPNTADSRKTVDEFNTRNGIDIYNPATWQNNPEVIHIMAKVPPQKLVDALNIMVQRGTTPNPDAIISLYRTLTSYTGYGSPKDVLGDSLGGYTATNIKKVMLDDMIEGIDAGLYRTTQEAIDAMISRKTEVTQNTIEKTLGASADDKKTIMNDILNSAVGKDNIDNHISDDFKNLATQLAGLGYDQEDIKTKLKDIFEREYGDAGVVVDFDRPLEGRKKTRMSLDKLTRNGEEVSDIHAVLNQQLKTLDAVLFDPNESFPIGFTTRTKGFLEGQFEWFEDPRFEGKSMVVLSPAPDATKANPKFLTYQVRRRDGILILDPFIVEKDGKALWPSFDINSEMVEARGFREQNNQAMERSRLEVEAAQAAADDEAERIRLQNIDEKNKRSNRNRGMLTNG